MSRPFSVSNIWRSCAPCCPADAVILSISASISASSASIVRLARLLRGPRIGGVTLGLTGIALIASGATVVVAVDPAPPLRIWTDTDIGESLVVDPSWMASTDTGANWR